MHKIKRKKIILQATAHREGVQKLDIERNVGLKFIPEELVEEFLVIVFLFLIYSFLHLDHHWSL